MLASVLVYFSVVKPVFGNFWVICRLNQVLASIFVYFAMLKLVFGHFWVICRLNQVLTSVFGYFLCVETRFSSFFFFFGFAAYIRSWLLFLVIFLC